MNLLMLTKFYPFGTGEAFIENEIKVLANYYDKITIIACEVTKEDKATRELPDNVTAYKILSSSKSKDIFKGLSYLIVGNDDLNSEKKVCPNMLSRGFLCYFESKSQRVFNSILEKNFIDEVVKDPYILYSYWFFMTARVGTLIAERHKPVYMFTRAHRYDLYEENNRMNYLPYRKLFLKSYDSIFPCSKNGTEYLRKKYPDISSNVITSLLGTLDHGAGHRSKDGVFRVVSCSRVEPVKRVSKIIEALRILDEEGLKIEWTHIGVGTQFEIIKKEAEQNLKNIKYTFMGNLKNADVMKLYSEKAFDLFVNVSSSEGLPVSIMEAISFDMPIVATDVGGTSEIVIDGYTGKLISKDFNPKELAEIIREFVTNVNPVVSRGSCRSLWEKNFQAILNYHQMYMFVKEKYTKKLRKSY